MTTERQSQRDAAMVYARLVERERRLLAAARGRGAAEEEQDRRLGRLFHWQDMVAATM